MKKGQIISLVVIAIVIIVVIVIISKNLTNTTTSTGGGGTTISTGGIGDAFGWVKNLFGKKEEVEVNCDPNKPGYDMNGFPNIQCGFG